MGYSDILKISFGKSTAEYEKESLDKYFITTQAYLNAKNKNRRKVYYIGHRGAGKSALLNQLSREVSIDKKNIVLNITPEQFSYEIFEKRKHDFYDVRTVYGAVWHYTILVQLFKTVVDYFESNRNVRSNKENVEQLKNFLFQRNFIETKGLLNIFFKYLKEFSSRFKYKDFEIGTSRSNNELVRFLNLSEISREKNCLLNVCNAHPIYIFIDELDTGWNNSKEARNFIYGLFYAVEQIRKLRNIRIYVSLRSDMYYNLSDILPDAEKMRDDVETFSWSPKTLIGLIGKRILTSWPDDKLQDLTSEDAVSVVFDSNAFDYILRHTLHRPREVIQFCNEALDEFRNSIHLKTRDPNKITLDIVQAVKARFSHYRFNDLCNEYKYNYPGLKTLLVNFENQAQYYSMEEFSTRIEDALLSACLKLGDGNWLSHYIDQPIDLVRILFDIGFIKVSYETEGTFFGYYEKPVWSFTNIKKVKIHDVFASALKCASANA